VHESRSDGASTASAGIRSPGLTTVVGRASHPRSACITERVSSQLSARSGKSSDWHKHWTNIGLVLSIKMTLTPAQSYFPSACEHDINDITVAETSIM
jgi:hypothetical protein